MKIKWKNVIFIVLSLIVGLCAGAFIQFKIDSKYDDEMDAQLQDATAGVLLYSVGYNNITKAIVEFAEAYPDYAQYLVEAPSFKKFVDGGCHEKISDWESKEHKYNIDFTK